MTTVESATKDLKKVLNEVVEQYSDIDAIFIYDLTNSTLLDYSDTKTKPGSGKLVNSLFAANSLGMGEFLSEFGDIRELPKALGSFGDETKSGKLKYATFQLASSIVQTYFLPEEVIGTNAAICFVSAQSLGLGKFVLQCERSIERIKETLKATF